MTSTSTKVFDLTQLLEWILLSGLSPGELTRARQVCSRFRAVIDCSKPLLRATFMEPQREQDHEIYEDSPPLEGMCGPHPKNTVATVHPAICTEDVLHNGNLALNNPPAPWALWPPGKWQSSLITQPPAITYSLVCCNWSDDAFDQEKAITVKGQTLGALKEAIDGLDDNIMVLSLECAGLWDERSWKTALGRRKAEIRRRRAAEDKIFDDITAALVREKTERLARGEDEKTAKAGVKAWFRNNKRPEWAAMKVEIEKLKARMAREKAEKLAANGGDAEEAGDGP